MSDLSVRAKALADEATPGPWVLRNQYDERADVWYSGGGVSPYVIADRIEPNDAEFIAASRELVPALAAEVERLEAEKAELLHERKQREDMLTLVEKTKINMDGQVYLLHARRLLEHRNVELRQERDELVGRNEQLQAIVDDADFGFDVAVKERDKLQAERNLLGGVLGRLLVALGVVNDVPLTGPQLLAFGEDGVERARALLASLEDSP